MMAKTSTLWRLCGDLGFESPSGDFGKKNQGDSGVLS
jgi:hypothetical protein